MTNYEAGTLLTCSHEGCGCRVRIEVPCHCAGAGDAYRCTAATNWPRSSRPIMPVVGTGLAGPARHRPNPRPASLTLAASFSATAEAPTATV